MTNHQMYKLSDRPKWWGVKVLRWAAIGLLIISVLSFVGSTLLELVDIVALGGASEEHEVILGLSAFAYDLAWAALSVGFYAIVLWFLAEIVGKIDQLVWLNATDEDRSEIIQKRKKKNAKNN